MVLKGLTGFIVRSDREYDHVLRFEINLKRKHWKIIAAMGF